MKKAHLFCFVFYAIQFCFGQSTEIIIPSTVFVSRDTTVKKQLISSLNGFLQQKDKDNTSNAFQLKEDLLSTSALLDEMKDIEKNERRNLDHFYHAYLQNSTRLSDSLFLIQIAYMGINDSVPELRALFTLMAKRSGDGFLFSSPLKSRTAHWKSREFGNTKVYFKEEVNVGRADSCFDLSAQFDRKIGALVLPAEYYACDNFNEVLHLVGVDYKLDYAGRGYTTLTANENYRNLEVNGIFTSEFVNFDPHDLWHSRLHKVIPASAINKPVDEGCAFLYGGSWGLSYEEIVKRFKKFVTENPNANWIELYNESRNFDPTAKYPLNVDYFINSMIVAKIEKEKGFKAVSELLRCGKRVDGNENYFQALEKVTGITKLSFNKDVAEMIQKL